MSNMLMCKICGHAWHVRKETRPYQCPKCRSTAWNGKVIQRKFNFGALAVGDSITYCWYKDISENYKINRALASYSQRTKRKFKAEPSPSGLQVTRLI